jgi:hypothetical protein
VRWPGPFNPVGAASLFKEPLKEPLNDSFPDRSETGRKNAVFLSLTLKGLVSPENNDASKRCGKV